MARTEAREAAMKILYEDELGGSGRMETLDRLTDYRPDAQDTSYIEAILSVVKDRKVAFDEQIGEHAQGWALERIAKTDLCILRLALAEMLGLPGEAIPVAVSINEAVELAKRFSADEAPAFINGILGSIARERESTG